MYARNALRTIQPSIRARLFSTTPSRKSKVAVLGAGGGIGQPLSLLLKTEPLVTSLSLYDIRGAPGVAADVSHIDTASEVKGYAADSLDEALDGADVVIIPAGVPRKPGMTRDDLFNTNATIVKSLATAIAKVSPKALILVISNPVNSTVPIVASTLEANGVFDPTRLFGVTTLDVVRASRFLGEVTSSSPTKIAVPVIGGHSGVTIVPLLSQSSLGSAISDIKGETYEKLVYRIQYGGDEVVKAKDGAGSATLSMAYAGAKFATCVLRGLSGEKGVITPSFVRSPLYEKEGVEFFSSLIELGPNGVSKINPVGPISPEEQKLLDAALPELKKNIQKGKDFVATSSKN